MQVEHDGWVSVRLDDVVTIHVRVGEPEVAELGGGYTMRRPVITSLLIEAPDVTTDLLRQIRPGRVVASIDPANWIPGDDDSQTTLADLRSRAAGIPRGRKREPVGRPDGTNPDPFYRQFADAYRSAATDSSRPAVLLAEENDVPVETVRRWIKEARRRRHLEPGRRGRAG